MRTNHVLLLLCVSLLAWESSTYADEISRCATSVFEPQRKKVEDDDNRIHISSDKFEAHKSNRFSAEGNISVQTPTQYFEADKATYLKDKNSIQAESNINFREGNIELRADELQLDLTNNTGTAKSTRYQLIEEDARGRAEKIAFEDNIVQLDNTTYTTCADGEEQWQLKAESITLNHAQNEGVAYNTRLEIMGTPILYLPYISFPLAGRKTGFLAPSPAYSSTNGFDLSVPYYLNLAPNYDMTLTPRFIENRGGQLSTEFRYLQKNFNTSLGYEYLPYDTKTKTDRSFAVATFEAKATKNTKILGNFAQVSDTEYFHDLSSTLNTVNKTQISRDLRSTTLSNSWQLNTLFQDFQILDGAQEPYRRLPQISLGTQHQGYGLTFKTRSEYSYFNRSSNDIIQRMIFQPELSVPIEKMAGFFIPSITLQASIHRSEKEQTVNHKFYNWLFRTDSGLFFERKVAKGLQTLEPRLGYVYIPNKKQSEIPLIDSSILDINSEQLFAANRYGGYDRVGGDNRISWALSSRLLTADGNEKYKVSFTQAHYLQDLTSHIPGEKRVDAGDTISAINLYTRLGKTLSSSAQAMKYSTEHDIHKGNVALRYFDNQELFEIAYRVREKQIEQISGLGILNISQSWRIAGRWLYSLKTEQTQEALLGLEYNNCCWSVRFLARSYNTDLDTAMKTSFGLQIELKGLARFGNNVDKQFSDEVLGNL